ncbi:HNH endonuclease [Aureimonas frigidaquae]|uniref:HNH endonuclease n=1 Tax=Aureimonas frigidaquae TaxID=424757 RepID=UPI000784D007|nr:HNH endonuclease signature motif containing protein [Aureimonas frigidaquae]
MMKLKSFSELAEIRAGNHADHGSHLLPRKVSGARPSARSTPNVIRAYIDRDETPSGMQTNWNTGTANDNKVPAGMSVERACEITPSIEAIERVMKNVELVWKREPRRLGGGGKQELHAWPVKRVLERDQLGDVARQRIGDLVFDGKNALLGHRERATREKGSAPQTIPNCHVAAYVGAPDIAFKPAAKEKRKGIPMTKAEARAYLREMGVDGEVDLPEACVNAGVGIYAKPSRPALPAGSPVVGNIFLGQTKAPPKKGGTEMWQVLAGNIQKGEIEVPDHNVALANGGTDDDSNVQCLCNECHDVKTRADLGYCDRRPTIGVDGWPIVQ